MVSQSLADLQRGAMSDSSSDSSSSSASDTSGPNSIDECCDADSQSADDPRTCSYVAKNIQHFYCIF